ncbi:MAG TPA: Uma2 family endonuclease [Ktedonobacteraceae bacterium]|nr:Uma2 family endonuclease [Ktedonobacteraceae bacterium]
MALPKYPIMDIEDYLTLDRNSKNARYEYLEGELRMLAGGSIYHSIIIANLTSILHRLLEDSPCCVYNSDIRVQLSEARYVYPDITISCDQRDLGPGDMIHYPRVIVEVLSPSTEAIDRGRKFLYYRECPTVQEYVMVDAQSMLIEVYHREDGKWTLSPFGPGSEVRLESVNIQFPIDTAYRKIKFIEGNQEAERK